MPTIVTKSIGSAPGRDFNSIQAWLNACPGDLIEMDQVWRGECYNDSEFVLNAQINTPAIVTDANRYVELTAAPGHSFADHVNKNVNPLKYNQAVGVGIRMAYFYAAAINITIPNFRISRLQFIRVEGDAALLAASSTVKISQCIFDNATNDNYALAVDLRGGATLINSLIIQRAQNQALLLYNATAINCTIVAPGGGNVNSAVDSGYGTAYLYNCAIFGFSASFSNEGGGSTTGNNNATNVAVAPGTNNQVGLTYANQFQNITALSPDFRVVDNSSLRANGITRAETGAIDIAGRPRHATAPTIGAWEVITTVSLDGNATSNATATGTIIPEMRISGNADVTAKASGSLSSFVAPLNTSIHAQIQTLSPDGVIELFELDATKLGATQIYRFHAGTNELSAPIVWQGNQYTPAAIQVSGIEYSGKGTLPRPTVVVSNANSFMSYLIMNLSDLVGAKFTRKRTLVRFLDSVNFPGGVNPNAENQQFPEDVFYVNRKIREGKIFVEFELASAFDVEGVLLPGRQIIANTCPSPYRIWNASLGAFDYTDSAGECGYAGSLYFRADGTVTYSASEDKCGKKQSDCKLRHPNQDLPYGGFPMAGRIGAP